MTHSCHICDAVLPAHNLICPRSADNRPTVGHEFNFAGQTIVPTYIRESERPTGDGACVTESIHVTRGINARGWYVEFTYPGSREQYRTFIPFEGAK